MTTSILHVQLWKKAGYLTKDVFGTALSLANETGCENVHDFVDKVELAKHEIDSQPSVPGKPESKVRQEFGNTLNSTTLCDQFTQFMNDIAVDAEQVNELSKNTSLPFSTNQAAVYHAQKHGEKSCEAYSIDTNDTNDPPKVDPAKVMDGYMKQIPEKFFKRENVTSMRYSQDGRIFKMSYRAVAPNGKMNVGSTSQCVKP
uniref:Uncharacterized protein n=1 Tax=Plectus sambesii TaxID=2011161 RepID=A0A914W7H2_9BILA